MTSRNKRMKNENEPIMAAIRPSILAVMALFIMGARTESAATMISAFYLDIGASTSVGVQPTAAVPSGQPTNHGYANYLVALEAAKGVMLQLNQIGCPGESTTGMLDGDGHCYRSPSTQLAKAVSFLRAHRGERGLVTVDLGFNDVVPCLKTGAATPACMDQRLALVRRQLPRILNSLKASAGPNVRFVGVGHYDPFLADSLSGAAGKTAAARSLSAINSLNQALSSAYKAYAMPVADVAGTFKSQDRTPVALAGAGTVPENVAEVCAMTWMCHSPPLGPNLHPNDVGYLAIAGAIAAEIPSRW